MAKKKINKSELIREQAKTTPGAKPSEIVEALAAKHVKVSAQLVSNVLGRVGTKKVKKKAGKKSVGSKWGPVGDASPVEAIKLARQFANAVGGTEAATEILAALGK